MMSIDFLIGAIRASRDLHPQVKTELEEILHRAEPVPNETLRKQAADAAKRPDKGLTIIQFWEG